MARKQPVEIKSFFIPNGSAAYLKQIALNRFFDNIERALKGDEECKSQLLNEDIADMREYITPIFAQVRDILVTGNPNPKEMVEKW